MERGAFRFAGWLAVGLALLTVLLSWVYDLPLKDPDSVAGPMYVRLPLILAAAFLLDVIPRALWATRGAGGTGGTGGTGDGGGLWGRVVTLTRQRWAWSRLRFVLLGVVAWYVTYASFRNLKAFAPYLNPYNWDGVLADADRLLWLGREPAAVLQSLLGTDVAATVLSAVYLVWVGLVPFTLIVALVWWPRRGEAAWFVTAIAVDWALGAVSHAALPSLGPIYADPAAFEALPATDVTWMQQMLWAERHDYLVNPMTAETLQGVAAFASLHVALVATMAVMAHVLRLHRVLRWSLWAFLFLTFLSTVYFGWHYSIDGIAGVGIGVAGVWLAAKPTGNTFVWRWRADDPALDTPAHDESVNASVSRSA